MESLEDCCLFTIPAEAPRKLLFWSTSIRDSRCFCASMLGAQNAIDPPGVEGDGPRSEGGLRSLWRGSEEAAPWAPTTRRERMMGRNMSDRRRREEAGRGQVQGEKEPAGGRRVPQTRPPL
eukprot:1106804-Rhodomonas_salina.2